MGGSGRERKVEERERIRKEGRGMEKEKLSLWLRH